MGGWLSLATRILPKVWRAGSKATSTLWKGGSTVLGAGGKALTVAAKNPKATAAMGVATFAGWRMLEHPEESVGTAVGKTVRGAVDQSGDFAHDAVNGFTGENTVEDVTETAGNVVDGLKETVSETKSVLGSLGDTLQGLGSSLANLLGGGLNMFCNFFSNLASGKVSALSIGGLIAAGYLMFGRSGLLGKIGGALLAMMMINGNSRKQASAVAQENTRQQSQEQQHGMHR